MPVNLLLLTLLYLSHRHPRYVSHFSFLSFFCCSCSVCLHHFFIFIILLSLSSQPGGPGHWTSSDLGLNVPRALAKRHKHGHGNHRPVSWRLIVKSQKGPADAVETKTSATTREDWIFQQCQNVVPYANGERPRNLCASRLKNDQVDSGVSLLFFLLKLELFKLRLFS
jgi:hypothetical protein